jgi:uracil-DNA glycosylase family 4
LCEFRAQNRVRFPDYFNGPVPPFGPPFVSPAPKLLIVGLAPGLHGANNTGRPFTADYAGDLLYPTLVKFGFAKGEYAERADDGLRLVGARITNAVRCVPPENKPLPAEIKTCNQFLKSEIGALQKDLRVIVALGLVAHQAILMSLGLKIGKMKFGHGTEYTLPGDVKLVSSYHCSRYNTSTKRLTFKMFEDIFARVREIVDQQTSRRADEAQYGAK